MDTTKEQGMFSKDSNDSTSLDTAHLLDSVFSLTSKKDSSLTTERVSEIIQEYVQSFSKAATSQMVYVVDYHKKEIIYSAGFEKNLGVPDPISVYTLYNHVHPADILTVLKLGKAAISYSILTGEMMDPYQWVLAHDYRLRTNGGKYKRYVRHSYIIHYSEGILDLTLNLLTEVTFLKPKGSVQWELQGRDLETFRAEVEKELTRQPSEATVLSRREVEILHLLAMGNTSDKVSKALHISPLTVTTHRKNIMKKLKVKNTNEMVYVAVKEGLL